MTSLVLGGCLLLLAAPVPVPEPSKNADTPADGVLARGFWQPPAALHRGGHQYIFRDGKALAEAMRKLAARPGPIVRLQALNPARLAAGEDYNLADLVEECSISTNVAAAGGNASLMAIG